MIPDKRRANLPMIKALNATRARPPMINGRRAAALSLNKRRSGNNNFFVFFPLPRAESEIIYVLIYF